MTLKTAGKRLAAVEDATAQRAVDELLDKLCCALGVDEADRFWELWHTAQRSPEESQFVVDTLSRPEVRPAALGYALMTYCATIRGKP